MRKHILDIRSVCNWYVKKFKSIICIFNRIWLCYYSSIIINIFKIYKLNIPINTYHLFVFLLFLTEFAASFKTLHQILSSTNIKFILLSEKCLPNCTVEKVRLLHLHHPIYATAYAHFSFQRLVFYKINVFIIKKQNLTYTYYLYINTYESVIKNNLNLYVLNINCSHSTFNIFNNCTIITIFNQYPFNTQSNGFLLNKSKLNNITNK
ncbi:hypothetical protein AGLY_006077 [Aphis glycines]|uniref:Uncharacterized protein n=1 Tax=Aphis glycines TaxID=307491 RepID=A0A6G0TST0_APHGL|nr:hypothetical protein AGLY_006077 [Aphis glycines]